MQRLSKSSPKLSTVDCRLSTLLVLACIAFGARATTQAADAWPSFRGDPQLSGSRPGPISDSPRLLWSFDSSTSIESTAAIAGGRVFVGCSEGLLALELAAKENTGKLVWKHLLEVGVRSSPAVDNEKVFFGDDAGIFHALDAVEGKPLWTFDTEGGAEIISSATVLKDPAAKEGGETLLLFGSYDGHLFCLDAATGKLRWKFLTGGPVHSTPAVGGGKTFVAGCDEVLRGVEVRSGNEVFQLRMGAYSAASPAVLSNRLFVGTFGNQVQAVDHVQVKPLWTFEHATRKFPFAASPAATEGVVVAAGRDKHVYALDPESGKVRWEFATRAKIESSPLIAGKRVVVASGDKHLYLLDLESGGKVWSWEADAGFLASPALASGRLVISTERGLVLCFDVAVVPAGSEKGGSEKGGSEKAGSAKAGGAGDP
jgi:outer membrane protein assembly factor BamB